MAALSMLFLMPILLGITGLAQVATFAYPAGIACAAFWLARRAPPAFVALVLVTVITTPGLRHFVDWYIGFSQTNPMMLAPYLAVYAAGPTVALHLLTGRRHSVPALILLLAVIAGLAMPIITGALVPAMLEAMRWAAPVCLAVYVWANADCLDAMRDRALRVFTLALPLVALYGIVQFAAILPWDAYYMEEAPITSIGRPEPYLVRVFATMNSPGSLAAMLATATLLLLPRARGRQWLGILLGVTCLLLTSQRAALGAFVAAFALLVLTSRDGVLRVRLLQLAATVIVALAVLLAVPGADEKVLGTFTSVTQLEDDESAQERLEQYRELPGLLDDRLLGHGLAWQLNPFYINVGSQIALDSGIIGIFVSLGVAGGCLYLTPLVALVLRAFRVAAQDGDPTASAEFAAVTFGIAQLPFGGQHTSEHGIFLYLALGLLLARRQCVPVPSRRLGAADQRA